MAMKVSLNWLKRFVDLQDSSENIAEVLAKIGMEVESVARKRCLKDEFIVVGKVVEFGQHPGADRLRLCRVDVGEQHPRQIVCGASNFVVNDVVPVALPGAILPDGHKIKKSKLRGMDSDGMMCSGHELGLGEDHSGIFILEKSWPLGTKLHEVFNDDDVIFELELTANRGDALSHYGVARELAAWYNLPLKLIEIPDIEKFAGAHADGRCPDVSVESENCEFYAAAVLKNIKISESVDWIRRDLESIGVAVVNNIVDVTNWVMFAYGQPLHAFDLAKTGSEIVVRMSRDGEEIATLDGKVHALDRSVLLICDKKKPLAVAGIIGGELTKITESTSEIVLEGACFSSDSIRRTSRRLGIATDSAYRYARRVDAAQTENFFKIAIAMMHDLYGAEVVLPTKIHSRGAFSASKSIKFTPDFIREVLGFSISDDTIQELLKRLQYKVHRENETSWVVESPSYRWDVTRPIDLAEECLRIYGVDKIPNAMPVVLATGNFSHESTKKRLHILKFLANNGFNECYNYSLNLPTGDALAVENPLLDDQTHFRTSLIPGLVKNLKYNLQNSNRYAKLCELGNIVRRSHDENFQELAAVAFLIPLESKEEHWEDFIRPTFFDAKNLLQRIWVMISDEAFPPAEAAKSDLFEPNFVAEIGNLETQSVEGVVGYLSSDIIRDFQMPLIAGEVVVKIPQFNKKNQDKRYLSFSCFPAAKRDISLVVERDYPAQSVINEIRSITESIARGIFSAIEVSIFDIYTGANVAGGKKSIGLNLTFRNDTKTPSEGEIDGVFEGVILAIQQHPTFSLRG